LTGRDAGKHRVALTFRHVHVRRSRGILFVMPSDETAVLAANEAFYVAFARRDLQAMDGLWARRATVSCIHPGWEPLRGRAEVMASFHAILTGPGAPPVKSGRAAVTLLGDAAFVICSESIDGAELVATNFFVREDDAWKLVMHQAGPVARRAEPPPRRKPPGMLN
jgi:ketosteroid isomerase-like protein